MQLDMTQVLIAFIAALPATIAAIATLIVTIRNGTKVQAVLLATNSMRSDLVVGIRKVTESNEARLNSPSTQQIFDKIEKDRLENEDEKDH